MAAELLAETTSLLVRTAKAHGVYEENDLNGVYDQAWSKWYAQYAVDNGIGSLVGHTVTADQLAQFLASSNVDFERDKPGEPWAAYTARRIIQEL
jgi:hypothetical protein